MKVNVKRAYYPINEDTARVAKELNSFRSYTPGSATEGYKSAVNEVYDIVDEIKVKKPVFADKAAYMADRFAKRYADYLNAYYRNEASCPSVMICGPANFPTRKKEKQNSRRDTLMAEYNKLMDYKKKIENILTCNNPILSGDENALELLQDKLTTLEAEKALMKDINAYYRKNGSMEGFSKDIPEKLKSHIDFMILHKWDQYGLFDTSNINAEINRVKERIEKLSAIKSEGNKETEHDNYTVVENVDIMRLQILFDDIPTPEVRNILKHNGFKWSPKNQAWQRQLTDNARFALKRIEKELSA